MQVHHLRSFLAVVDAGSFSAAAKLLGYTQQAVSLHVAAVEKWYGRPLLRRGWDGAAATADGRRLAFSARATLGSWDALAPSCVPRRGLTLGNQPPAGWPALGTAIATVRALVPAVQLVSVSQETMWQRLQSGDLDLLVGYGPAPEGMLVLPAGSEPRELLHAASTRPPAGADRSWLRTQPMLGLLGEPEVWRGFWADPFRPQRRLTVSSCSDLQLAVVSGAGVSVVPAGLRPSVAAPLTTSELDGLEPAPVVVACRRTEELESDHHAVPHLADLLATLVRPERQDAQRSRISTSK